MNSLIESSILGVVQGLTEFLPVSSSGHLILAREVFGMQAEYGLAFDALLHLATALAIIVYFREDLFRLVRSLVGAIREKTIEPYKSDIIMIAALGLGTIPAVCVGLLFESAIETTFRSAVLVAATLIAGSVIMVAAEHIGKRLYKVDSITLGRGFLLGCFQTLALIPGMSRSGMTISGGLLLGLSREAAARFAFLLGIPVILGAGAKKALDLSEGGVLGVLGADIIVGSLAAFVSGLIVIHYLLRFLRNNSLMPFVVYRVILAVIILFVAL